MKNRKLWLLVGGIVLVLVLAVTPLMTGCAKPAEEVKPPVEEKPPVEKPPAEKPPAEKPAAEKPAEPEFTLKFQTVFDKGHTAAIDNDIWMDFIEQETNGRVKFERYYSGTLIDFFEIGPATSKGVLQAGSMLPDWTPATFDWTLGITRAWVEPSAYVFTSAGYDIMKSDPRLLEEYRKANLHINGPWASCPFYLMSKKPVTSKEDLVGLSLFDQDCVGWNAIGANCMFVGVAELYDSIVKGLLDGMNNGIESLDMFRVNELCPYFIDCGEGVPGFLVRVINLDTWNKLPPDIQEVFEKAARPSIERYIHARAAEDAEVLKRWVEQGIQVSRLPEKDRQELRRIAGHAAREVWVNVKSEEAEERWEYLAVVDAYFEKWRGVPEIWADPLTPYLE